MFWEGVARRSCGVHMVDRVVIDCLHRAHIQQRCELKLARTLASEDIKALTFRDNYSELEAKNITSGNGDEVICFGRDSSSLKCIEEEGGKIRLLLTGRPGTGKTTFLDYFRCSTEVSEKYQWVFKVDCQHLATDRYNSGDTLPDMIVRQYFPDLDKIACEESPRGCYVERESEFRRVVFLSYLKHFLEKHGDEKREKKVLLILDALDEVPKKSIAQGRGNEIIYEIINRDIGKYSEHSDIDIILSARNHTVLEDHSKDFANFIIIEMQGFSDSGRKEYIERYFQLPPKLRSNTDVQRLNDQNKEYLKILTARNRNRNLHRACRLPAILDAACQSIQRLKSMQQLSESIENKQFRDMCDEICCIRVIVSYLLIRYLGKTGQTKPQDLHSSGDDWFDAKCDKRILFLEYFAFYTWVNQSYSGQITITRDYLKQVGEKNYAEEAPIDQLQLGLLTIANFAYGKPADCSKAHSPYEFVHSLFREYFAARFLAKCIIEEQYDPQKSFQSLTKRGKQGRWYDFEMALRVLKCPTSTDDRMAKFKEDMGLAMSEVSSNEQGVLYLVKGVLYQLTRSTDFDIAKVWFSLLEKKIDKVMRRTEDLTRSTLLAMCDIDRVVDSDDGEDELISCKAVPANVNRDCGFVAIARCLTLQDREKIAEKVNRKSLVSAVEQYLEQGKYYKLIKDIFEKDLRRSVGSIEKGALKKHFADWKGAMLDSESVIWLVEHHLNFLAVDLRIDFEVHAVSLRDNRFTLQPINGKIGRKKGTKATIHLVNVGFVEVSVGSEVAKRSYFQGLCITPEQGEVDRIDEWLETDIVITRRLLQELDFQYGEGASKDWRRFADWYLGYRGSEEEYQEGEESLDDKQRKQKSIRRIREYNDGSILDAAWSAISRGNKSIPSSCHGAIEALKKTAELESKQQSQREEKLGLREIEVIDGFVTRDVEDNGNCLFHAVADQLLHLRHPLVSDWEREQSDLDFHQWLRGYTGNVLDKNWGSDDDMYVLAEWLNVVVAVIDTRLERTDSHPSVHDGFICRYFDTRDNSKGYTNSPADPYPCDRLLIRLGHTGDRFISIHENPELGAGAIRREVKMTAPVKKGNCLELSKQYIAEKNIFSAKERSSVQGLVEQCREYTKQYRELTRQYGEFAKQCEELIEQYGELVKRCKGDNINLPSKGM